MPNKKITQLTALASLTNLDLLPVVDDSDITTKKVTAQVIKDYIIPPGIASIVSTVIDLDAALPRRKELTLAGALSFTTTNRVRGAEVHVRILPDVALRALTFPAWVTIGDALPASLAANKNAVLELVCYGTAETDILATWLAEP